MRAFAAYIPRFAHPKIAGIAITLVLSAGFFACLSMAIAGIAQTRDRLMGIGQLMTRDNYRSMQGPNVCSGEFPFGAEDIETEDAPRVGDGVGHDAGWPLYLKRYAALFTDGP